MIAETDRSLVFGQDYLKINTVFKRDEKNLIIPGEWSLPEFEYLADCVWRWTEKVDGTNIRVHWNGENVTIGGRTDNAQVPTFLIAALVHLTSKALWADIFPDSTHVTLYGEGYGPKIQNGGQYRDTPSLILFDVRVGSWWLKPEDVADIASKFGLDVVPFVGTLKLHEAVEFISTDGLNSHWPNARMEGIVGTPLVDLYNRKGERIIAKIKGKDFADLRRRGGA